MTDKQIIIDGVDVSGCKHFENADQEMCCELTCCGGCRGINCYYKQLKAKEQECEAYKMEAEEGKEINAELKAELEALKSFDINLVGVKECEIRQLVQYRKTLAEIKEIAENNKRAVLCFTAFEGDAIEVNNEPMTAILQKISEVENG